MRHLRFMPNASRQRNSHQQLAISLRSFNFRYGVRQLVKAVLPALLDRRRN